MIFPLLIILGGAFVGAKTTQKLNENRKTVNIDHAGSEIIVNEQKNPTYQPTLDKSAHMDSIDPINLRPSGDYTYLWCWVFYYRNSSGTVYKCCSWLGASAFHSAPLTGEWVVLPCKKISYGDGYNSFPAEYTVWSDWLAAS